MSTKSDLKGIFSSFTIKLFLWFWLIAVISITSTRFISHQLSKETFNKVTSQSATPEELRQLNSISRRFNRDKINSIDFLKKLSTKRYKHRPLNIWLKASNSKESATHLFPIPKKHKQTVSTFINDQIFEQPKTYLFSHTRLIGPVPVVIKNQPHQLFISHKHHRRDIGKIIESLPIWGRVAIPTLISFVFCLLLARSFSKPIRTIKQASSDIGKGDFSTRVPISSQRNDEIGQLARSFNEMASQLQQHQSAQQRLLGDVSHELRSPMTRLQMALGLAQQETTTTQAREQYLQRCQIEVDRLDQMVADVLSLSRLENTLQTIQSEKINLCSLLANIISDEQFVADEKSIKICFIPPKDIFFNGDSTLLISAISNILSNAVKYSPENSNINVELAKADHHISLIIDDAGQGVPEQALSQLFNPFYRVNLARDRNTGGTGLGLAIAKQAILAHKGKVTARNKIAKNSAFNEQNSNSVVGLSVIIELPCL